jgi:hypothetical protein
MGHGYFAVFGYGLLIERRLGALVNQQVAAHLRSRSILLCDYGSSSITRCSIIGDMNVHCELQADPLDFVDWPSYFFISPKRSILIDARCTAGEYISVDMDDLKLSDEEVSRLNRISFEFCGENTDASDCCIRAFDKPILFTCQGS